MIRYVCSRCPIKAYAYLVRPFHESRSYISILYTLVCKHVVTSIVYVANCSHSYTPWVKEFVVITAHKSFGKPKTVCPCFCELQKFAFRRPILISHCMLCSNWTIPQVVISIDKIPVSEGEAVLRHVNLSGPDTNYHPFLCISGEGFSRLIKHASVNCEQIIYFMRVYIAVWIKAANPDELSIHTAYRMLDE